MSWTITGTQKVPAVIGEPFGGGYFAGYISHTANGNATHALIVAPRQTGLSGSQWKTTATTTAGTTSSFDGYANTQAMIAAGINIHPAAKFCVDLNIGGYTDWYLPSVLELDIAYFNLKPTTASNDVNFGINTYSVPIRNSNYTSTYPSQTPVGLFTLPTFMSNAQTLDPDVNVNVAAYHWSSTEINANFAWLYTFRSGNRGTAPNNFSKTVTTSVRAFRRIAL